MQGYDVITEYAHLNRHKHRKYNTYYPLERCHQKTRGQTKQKIEKRRSFDGPFLGKRINFSSLLSSFRHALYIFAQLCNIVFALVAIHIADEFGSLILLFCFLCPAKLIVGLLFSCFVYSVLQSWFFFQLFVTRGDVFH